MGRYIYRELIRLCLCKIWRSEGLPVRRLSLGAGWSWNRLISERPPAAWTPHPLHKPLSDPHFSCSLILPAEMTPNDLYTCIIWNMQWFPLKHTHTHHRAPHWLFSKSVNLFFRRPVITKSAERLLWSDLISFRCKWVFYFTSTLNKNPICSQIVAQHLC